MGGSRTSAGQPLVAIDAVRRHSGIADIHVAKEPGVRSLCTWAHRVGEIPAPVFAAGRHWEPSGIVTRPRSNEYWLLLCTRRREPGFYAADDSCSFATHCLVEFLKSGPSASGASCSSVALRISIRPFHVVHALAAGF